MTFEIVTLFPDYFSLSLKQSLVGKGVENGLFDIKIINLRDYAVDKHRTVDDTPFGGGGGMVMKVEPLDRCLTAMGWSHRGAAAADRREHLVLTSAAGKPLVQDDAVRYSLAERVTIICGHYLGVDDRVLQLYDIEEVSIGDYVLTGGEPAAAVMVDAIGRLIPGVLGNFESALEDSYMNQLLGSPCYTRPAEYEGLTVPDELLSGDHARIRQYRRRAAIARCAERRPELLERADLSEDEWRYARSVMEKKK
ncbi:MAG: tRNA (guanosine(37)-N1)-methyltransferase TrmD [candidate division Zixibacteria bacterium]|jgi:tRNA (guanine37-N1)-methyltransferase|nr:tRNA (guanosine(37)-N1)-methyltransferase TrmD [candidate division Zixibacteria bacterium]